MARKKKVEEPSSPDTSLPSLGLEELKEILPTNYIIEKKPKQKDDLAPVLSTVKPDESLACPQVIITYLDSKGKKRTVTYWMHELHIQENATKDFNGHKEQARIHLSLDGVVKEKS